MMRQTLIVLLFAAVSLADVGRLEVVETDSVEKVPGGGYRIFPGAKGPANMAPAPKPTPKADPATTQPATPLPGSSPTAASEPVKSRAARLKQQFEMTLEYHGPAKYSYVNLWLYDGPGRPGSPLAPPWLSLGPGKRQVEAIVRFLAEDGFLKAAEDIRDKAAGPMPQLAAPPDGPCYVMIVRCGKEVLYQNLGWGREMLVRLERLRRVLTGHPADAMDKLLERLEIHREDWYAGAVGQPAPKIDWRKEAVYEVGPWRYRYELTFNKGKHIIARRGHLYYRGKQVAAPGVNDRLRTPWGVLFDVGALQLATGRGGWMPAPSDQAKRKGRLLPSPLDAIRFQALQRRKALASLLLWEVGYRGGRPGPQLLLGGPDRKPGKPQDNRVEVRLSKGQMHALLERLAYSGWLGKAVTAAFVTPHAPAYIAHVADGDGKCYYRNLGWLPGMLEELPALRAALEGEAAKQMDKLLARLDALSRRWKATVSSPPTALQGIKKDLGDLIGLRWTVDTYDPPIGPVLRGNLLGFRRHMSYAVLLAPSKAPEQAGVRKYMQQQRTRGVRLHHLGSSSRFTVLASYDWSEEAVSQALMAALNLRRFPATQPGKTARDARVQQVCMAALRKMQKDFAALAAKHPKVLGHLGPGTIDEKKLLLRFPVKNLPKTTQPAQRATPAGRMRTVLRRLRPDELGLFVQFTVPTPIVEFPTQRPMARWLYSNVGLSWWWMWPNRYFSPKAQQGFLNMLSQALVPLNELENTMVAADLAKRQKGSYVLRGRPGVKLTIRLSPTREAAGTVVDLYATNETKGVLGLYPPFTQIIGDGKPWHYGGPGCLSMLTHAFGRDRDPFIYIKPGQTAKVSAVVVAGLSAGRHTVRVAAGHLCDYWIDVRPTFHDGPPITRKVPGAWTGVLVSGELAIDIPTPAAAKKKAAERAKLLKKTGTVYLVLQYHVGYIGARPSLHLATTNYKIELVGGILASLTPKEASNIIDHLAKEGFLGQAENVVGKDIAPPQGPAYTLTLMGAGQTKLYQVLGWDLKMLGRLEGLRKVLAKDSAAGKAMDKLLAALEPQRKKWENQADLEAAARILTKTVGGTWRTRLQYAGKDAPIALYGTMGQQDKSGEWPLWYVVFAFGRGDTPSQQLLLETYAYSGATILGAGDKYTVLQRGADAKAATKHSPAVVEALSLRPPATTLAAHAAKQVNTGKFMLELAYKGPRGKGYRGLTLRVPKVADRGTPMAPALQISAGQAGRIVEALLKAGYFHRARPFALGALEPLRGPAYVVQVSDGRQATYAVIGWNLETLGFLRTVRKALDGEAGKAMDKVIKALEPQRKKWQDAAVKGKAS